MKVILSRKGFDSSNGGCPSPIMPDGTLLSMPIPSNDDIGYDGLVYNGTTYKDILKQINPRKEYGKCHLEPDIRSGIRQKSVLDWKSAFGQINAAQGILKNAKVEVQAENQDDPDEQISNTNAKVSGFEIQNSPLYLNLTQEQEFQD